MNVKTANAATDENAAFEFIIETFSSQIPTRRCRERTGGRLMVRSPARCRSTTSVTLALNPKLIKADNFCNRLQPIATTPSGRKISEVFRKHRWTMFMDYHDWGRPILASFVSSLTSCARVGTTNLSFLSFRKHL